MNDLVQTETNEREKTVLLGETTELVSGVYQNEVTNAEKPIYIGLI